VEEDRLLKQLKKDLGGSFGPVKPLPVPWKRAIWIFPVSLLLTGITLMSFHLRPDYAAFRPMAFWGFCLLQIIASYLILTVSLEACIPGSARASGFFIAAGLLGLAVQVSLSWFIYRISPNFPAPGLEWHLGTACMLGVCMLGILALFSGFLLARAGLPIRARVAGVLFGLASGLAAEASWRVHCPITSWKHILLFHDGAIVAMAACGVILGLIWEKRKTGVRQARR
jgi:hypothetical protein